MTKSNILLIICLIFIGGLFLVSVFEISPIWGFLYTQDQIAEYNDLDKEVRFTGYVAKERDQRSNHVKLTVKTDYGKVLVTTRKYPEYNYGDELEMIGNLEAPAVFEDFNYQGYLAKEGIYSVSYYPKIKLISKNQGNIIYQLIYRFKDKVKKAVERIMPLPEVAVLEALVLGNKASLTENLKNQFNITGTRHIVAISGMHILILVKAIMIILLGIGLWRGQAFYFALGLLALFIIMVGAPASAVRAGIMAGILLLAEKIGRLNNSGRAVIFAATLMLIFNPLLLKFDVGFQLSFLAVLGIIYIKPIFDNWLEKIIKKEQLSAPLQIITMTLAAQAATLPILVYNFGRISFISPLANVLIVPILPYVMGAGFIFSFATVIWSFLGKILIWPAWFLFAYITKIVEWFSKIPFAAQEVSNIHWFWLVSYYILLIVWLEWYKKKKARDIFIGA